MKNQLILVAVLLGLCWSIYGMDVPADICEGQPNGILLPHPYNCTQFIICTSGMFIISTCPLYAPVFYNTYCFYGNPITCEVFIDTTTEFEDATETTEFDIETTTMDEFTTDLSTNEPTTTTRPPTTTPIPVHRCPPGGFGYIPHHTNCNRYFECIKGIRHMRFCPYGLLFDSVTLQCTYPELAVCAGYQ